MFTHRFGIEIEFTGITRETAARVVAEHLGGRVYGTAVTAPDGRVWNLVADGSIKCQRRERRVKVDAGRDHSVELVSPILTYREDIETLQEMVRKLRKAGGFSNETCGVHVHLCGAPHTPRSVRNFINIIASRNDLFYEALQIAPERMRYCKKMDAWLVEEINRRKPRTLDAVSSIWYSACSDDSGNQYRRHQSRYHFLNLHSLFTGNRTIELRGFNSELHAGKIRSYIVLALALNHQALTQKSATARKPQMDNPRFAMRTYLNRIGFIGDEFKNCRVHLSAHLSGSAAWRFGAEGR